MKIIIIQLARLGDVIQTLPTVQGLKKQHPGCEITLVTRTTFADAARICPHVDKLVEFPTADVLGPCFNASPDKGESFTRLAGWIAENFLGTKYDLLLNLTFSPSSAYLSTLIDAAERRGIVATKDAFGGPYVIHDPWSQYFFAQVVEHNINIIHLNDLFMRIAGVGPGAWPLDIVEPRPEYAPPAKAEGTMRIGIQLTASTDDKTLNYKVWAEICRVLLSVHETAELVFFGATKDLDAIRAVVEEVVAIAPGLVPGRCHVPASRVRFHENVPWIRSCDWIVAPDTAIVHLASACGTKVIEIPVGRVRPEETGPYGEGHFVVFPVRADGQQLAFEVAGIVGGQTASSAVAQARTRLTPTTMGVPRNEMVAYNFVSDEVSNFFMQAYYLVAEFRCGGRQEDIAVPKIGDPGQPTALDRLVNCYDALCTMRRLAEFGQHHCLKMLENIDDNAMLKTEMEKLAEIETLLAKMQNSVPLVKPLIDTWKVAKDVAYSPATELGQIEDILALTEGCYRELAQNIDIVQQLLQTAVEAAQGKIQAKQTEFVKPGNKRPEEVTS
ncbi:MAG: glycosyltransferase family 9 protein [Deltaproteobacteria bacterium]|nr:glycosyltransferase family 9 protein [Deltaproteobacteria bacterium]